MKAEFQGFLDQLKGTLTALGHSFAETFKQVGQVAAQQGGQLLQQALQQGAQLVANGAQSKNNYFVWIMKNTVFGEFINYCRIFVQWISGTIFVQWISGTIIQSNVVVTLLSDNSKERAWMALERTT